jgi:ubiquitin carboxyl-terminal hydrolase 5/13
VSQVINAVVNAQSSAKRSEVQAWEEEVTACEHTLCLEQDAPKQLESQQLAHCSECELRENLWLCLTCGSLGCGRRQYDGSGGNNHGLEHFEKTGHAVCCKLGTITPDGTAGMWPSLLRFGEKTPPPIKFLNFLYRYILLQVQ